MMLLVFLPALGGCGREAAGTEFLLGTICKIQIWGGGESDLEAAFNRVREIETIMSRNIGSSDIRRIVPGAPNGTRVSPETCKVIKTALDFGRLSGGLFDITIAPVVGLWGFETKEAGVPGPDELKAALPLVDYRRVKVFDDCRVALGAGQSMDLGGIAKGYASDEVARVLREAGVDRALINLGGNILALGKKKDGSPWKLGIQDPLQHTGATVGYLEVSGGAVVTSGVYERFFIRDGKKYHHILDPNTGFPVDNNLAGVSISSPSGLDADALSTVLFLMGVDKGCGLLKSFPDCGAVFVLKNKHIITCGTASASFRKTSQDYMVAEQR